MDKVLKLRRRPPATATNAKTSRQVFNDSPTKQLIIPRFIDDYNHYMGGVDQADQLRSYYNTQRTHRKNWKPLWHFLLDTTITNCFKIHSYRPPGAIFSSGHALKHKEFRSRLVKGLFERSERLTKPMGRSAQVQKPLTHYVMPDIASQHQHVALSKRLRACQACKTAGRGAATGAKRKALRELSHNIKRLKRSNEIKARRKDTKRTA